jgi:hypothetical protein
MEINKDQIIADLTDKLKQEKCVKDNEVFVNASYKQTIEKLEFQLNTLAQINDSYAEEIAKLRIKLKKLAVDTFGITK